MTTKQTAIRDWLNGDHDFSTGASIYCVWGEDLNLKKLFVQGKTPFTEKRLLEEMEKMHQPPFKAPVEVLQTTTQNPDLENACDAKSKVLWKEMMNTRAVLFNLARVENDGSVNTPDRIEKRKELALKVCADNYVVSKAYDDLQYVRLHGRLPEAEATDPPAVIEIADAEVKPSIDNLRKNLSKLRKRDPTPERIAIIQSHESNLKNLLVRWDSLKSSKKKYGKQAVSLS